MRRWRPEIDSPLEILLGFTLWPILAIGSLVLYFIRRLIGRR